MSMNLFHCNASSIPHQQVKPKKAFDTVKNLVSTIGIPSISSSPLDSLRQGHWFKLITGASFEDVVDIRNLSLVYTLAGVDCIDCAADAAVVSAVNEGIDAAIKIVPIRRPWVMISVNDDEDLHFRKAEFDPKYCPPDCLRPCVKVCPANAISLSSHGTNLNAQLEGGVLLDRCYGCGRCLPVCPYENIRAITYIRAATATLELLKRNDVDALEIHTSGRQRTAFKKLWNNLEESIGHVNLVAVSFPNLGVLTASSMHEMFSVMSHQLHCCNLWQLDGRPMSGDIGRGATKASINFAIEMAASRDRPPGFLQLAGGTNFHTIDGLKKVGLFRTNIINGKSRNMISSADALKNSPPAVIGGIAYGGYARKIVGRIFNKMKSHEDLTHIEQSSDYLLEALVEALRLMATVKCYNLPCP